MPGFQDWSSPRKRGPMFRRPERMARWVPTLAGTTLLLLAAVQASHGQAQGGADFYKGKTIRIVISTGVAGGFGEYARLLSEHIGKHIPGRPHVIVQSMPGAGGLLAANFLYASGAAGRHHHRHHQLDGAARAAVGQQGRALRHAEVQLARHPRPRRRRVHALAHFAGEDLGRHAGQGVHGREHRRGFADGALPGDAEQAVRRPGSR